jgi:hypothetical protein
MSYLTKEQADSIYQPLGNYITSTDLIKFKSGLDADMTKFQTRGNYITRDELMTILNDYQPKSNVPSGNMLSQQVTQAVQSSNPPIPYVPPIKSSPSTKSVTFTPSIATSGSILPTPPNITVPLSTNIPLPPPNTSALPVPISSTTSVPGILPSSAYLRYRNRQILY